MDEVDSIQILLSLRKLTRAIGDVVGPQAREYVAALAPAFRQKSTFGEHIQSTAKETAKGADQAFQELQSLYEKVAPARPFLLPRDLKSPMIQMAASLEMAAVEYWHTVTTNDGSRTIGVTRPYQWVLHYAGYAPSRLKDVATDVGRGNGELQQFVLHYLAMHMILSRQTGIKKIFEALHFPLTTGKMPGFGELPVTYIGSAVSTRLPPDQLILESTELSGKDVFEELVDASDIAKLADPLKERLAALVKT